MPIGSNNATAPTFDIIFVNKTEITDIDLSNVDPKTCFKSLKGVASSKLSTLTPIQPILQISHYDKRFVDSYEVADELDTSTNIAAMDWEDFEHLIREIFEKEFQVNGGEVKVTQASRDGGVDAVAFDPDPIRGGKIVIQAKRYTNVVGVSAKFSIGDKVTTVDGDTATVTMAEHPFYTVELEETGTTKSFNFKDLAPFQEKEISKTSEGIMLQEGAIASPGLMFHQQHKKL